MTTLDLFEEWDVARLVGISRPHLAGIAVDQHNRSVLLAEKTSHQVIEVQLEASSVSFFACPGKEADTLADVALGDNGTLYLCGSKSGSLYVCDRDVQLICQVPLVATPVHCSGTIDGVVLAHRTGIPPQVFFLSAYTSKGDQVWIRNLPPGCVSGIPVYQHSAVYFVAETDRIRIHRLDTSGNTIATADLAPGLGSQDPGSQFDGTGIPASHASLIHATRHPRGILALCTNAAATSAYRQVLLFHKWGREPEVLNLPRFCWRIAVVDEDRLIGYYSNVSTGECRLYQFHLKA